MNSSELWMPDGEGVVIAGDVSPDGQLTEAYEVRYHHTQYPDSMISVRFYGEDLGAPNEYTGVCRIEAQTEFMVCRDRKDPGATEKWCDYRYQDAEPGVTYTDVSTAEARARELAETHTADMIKWDGLPFYGPSEASGI